MNSRLKDDLDSFLIQYNLSMDSRIFEESLPLLAGISNFDENRLKKFRFVYTSKPGCTLMIPVKTSVQDKEKLFAFCEAPLETESKKEAERDADDSYESPFGPQLEIQELHLIEKIIPAFKAHIELFASQNDNLLKPYLLHSRGILATKALESIQVISQSLLELLNTDNEDISVDKKSLSMMLLTLSGLMSELSSHHHHVYPYLSDIIKGMENYLSCSNLKLNSKINQKMSSLFQSLESYLRYNDVEALLRSEKIFSNLNTFLFDKKISINECDIFENTLLELAGVMQYGNCKVDKDYEDNSRIMMSVGKLSQEDANKLIHFFHENGAKSAVITYSCYQRTPVIHDGDSSDGGPYAVVKLPNVRFSIDNQEMAHFILPVFYHKITELMSLDTSKLMPYQEQSKVRFKCDTPKIAHNPAQLFHVKKEVVHGGDELVQEQDNELGSPSLSLSRSQ